jgi:arylsulfatase
VRPLTFILLIAAFTPGASAADTPPRPNILLILADDLGYSDLGCYGGEIRTPHLDALAARGLRFSQFYNGGRCCPTRAALLTGLYPHQAGIGRMTMDAGPQFPGYRGSLTDNTVTLAEALRAAGYRTAMVGKWHLSLTRESPGHMRRLSNQAISDTFSDPRTYPVARGFERHYGVIWGVVNYYDPFSLVRGAEPVRDVPKNYYITDALTQEAENYLDDFARGTEPFFLYVAHVAPHWPLHAPPADIDRYADTYAAGWDAVRDARLKRLAEMNLLPANVEPAQSARATTWAQNPTRAWDARAMATHAAMITRMDDGVGRLVRKLEQTGRLDNTLVLFLSDNGASPEAYERPGFDRPAQTRDGRRITYPPDKTVMPGPEDTFFGIGPAWAHVANTPLRGHKAEMFEGGIRTPLIAHWPKGLRAAAGGVTHQVGHVIDVVPTCLELAGAPYPKEFQDRPITPAEGRSLAPVVRNEPPAPRPALAWEHFGARALRQGDWKLVSRRDQPWQLYDLSKDPTEQHDLAPAHPQRVEQMAADWDHWARRTSVYPAPQ